MRLVEASNALPPKLCTSASDTRNSLTWSQEPCGMLVHHALDWTLRLYAMGKGDAWLLRGWLLRGC